MFAWLNWLMFGNIDVQLMLSMKNDRNVIIWSLLWLMIKPSSSLGVIFHLTATCSPTEICLTLTDTTMFIIIVVLWGWFGLSPMCEQFVYMGCPVKSINQQDSWK